MKRDKLELFYLFLFLSLLVEMLAWGLACAEDSGECLPLDDVSAAVVAGELGLDLEQTVWLRREIAAGRLRRPRDLDAIPGAGAELREALAAAFCWGPPLRGRVLSSARSRPGGWQREVRLEARGDRLQAALRRRSDPAGAPLVRGGVRAGGETFSMSAGTLRARQGLGLLLATPGAQTRGSAPLAPSAVGWQPTTSLDPEVVRGIATRALRGEWQGEAAWMEDRFASGGDREGQGWMLGLQRLGAASGWGLQGLRLRGRTMVSVHLRAERGAATWGVEWAGGSGPGARAFSWAWKEGPWRLRGSLQQWDGGFQAPSAGGPSHPVVDAVSGLRLEARWQGTPGRFLRGAANLRREPERAGLGWMETSRRLELEVGDRPAPGWRVGWLWRETDLAPEGTVAAEALTRVLRLDVVRDRSGIRWSFRFERREQDTAGSELFVSRVTGGGDGSNPWEWEFRAAQAFRPEGSPSVSGYGRRAGGVHGWQDFAGGTWIGGWIRSPTLRLPGSPCRLELSLDGMSERWDLVVALEAWPGAE